MPQIYATFDEIENIRILIGKTPLTEEEIRRITGRSLTHVQRVLAHLSDDGVAIPTRDGRWGLL